MFTLKRIKEFKEIKGPKLSLRTNISKNLGNQEGFVSQIGFVDVSLGDDFHWGMHA